MGRLKRMLPFWLLVGGAGLLYWARRPSVVTTSGDSLREGGTYRARVQLAPGVYSRMRNEGRRPTEISRFVANEAKVAGFSKIHLVTEDPSQPGSYTLLGVFSGGSGSVVLQMFSAEEVEAPESRYAHLWKGPMLDDGLLLEEGESVLQALRENRDPKHLSGFASTLVPEFPVAASLLRAKSELCLQRKSGVFLEDVQKKHDRFAQGMKSVGVVVPPVTDAPPASFLSAMHALGVGEGFKGFRYPQALGTPETVWFGETAYRILRSIADGEKRVGRATRIDDPAEAKEVAGLKLSGTSLASITGYGAGVGFAQYAAACYALMNTALDAVSLGPAFDQAVVLSQALTKTETLEKTRADLAPEARVRFDVGVLFAEVALLRKHEFNRLWHFLPGSDPAEKAAHLKRFIALSHKEKKSVRDLLLADVVRGVKDLRVVYEAALMLNGELVKRTAPEVADKLGISPGDARAALASVVEVSEGIRYLGPEVFQALGPNTVARELLPPAAMQLAYATMRPEQSMVSDKEVAIEKAKAIHRLADEGGDAAKAKAQFDRAKRALERQKWVDWMKRKRQADSGSEVSGLIRT